MIDPNHQSARILAIDDEPANLKLLSKMLASQGYAAPLLVQDPCEAVAAYQAQRPDLILLDLNMPHLDGFGVMAALRALDDPLLPPIVVLTAQSGREWQLRALAAGARDFICKPFDRSELLMRVRNMLDAQLAHRLLHEHRQQLEAEVAARTRELAQSRVQIVQRLGRAAEFRDNETGQHVLRMSEVATIIARSLGWNEAQCELILRASPMHDIGKIGISDQILLKPGRLDDEEMRVMRTHSAIGAQILEGSDDPLLQMACRIARSHHEKWDGSGYPDGLAGEAIPLEARICAVADVFDALVSVRPYKRVWPIEEALALIEREAGHHFDPLVVEHFLANLEAVLEVNRRHREPE
ncbi:HD domain-containing phosphohydrolase [Crenobacter caeni]|uniref:Response regulator n=1 Tax=Crenobacter caeni TaxID=2705474 RepID=A0A6B2KTR8_9NEIS|nr:HD domain-containing phosphohydrolase [Crenobacter caeni]NDV13504.1 response regulator [Crenobacter caeni]